MKLKVYETVSRVFLGEIEVGNRVLKNGEKIVVNDKERTILDAFTVSNRDANYIEVTVQ